MATGRIARPGRWCRLARRPPSRSAATSASTSIRSRGPEWVRGLTPGQFSHGRCTGPCSLVPAGRPVCDGPDRRECEPVERLRQPSPDYLVAAGGLSRPMRPLRIADQSLAELRIVEDDEVLTADVFHLSALLLESSTTRDVVMEPVSADWASTRTHAPPI
jgi:hypothetical protein